MTEQEFKQKYNEIIDGYIDEVEKITERLKEKNKIQGLDTNNDEYFLIYQEYAKKTKKLREEYTSSKKIY